MTRRMLRKPETPAEILDRQPPCSLEAEAGVLGSVLCLPSVCEEVARILGPADFWDEGNRTLFKHLAAMHAAGEKIDLTLLAEHLKRSPEDWQRLGGDGVGSAFLAKTFGAVVHAHHAVYYAEIVKEKAQRRGLLELCAEGLKAAHNGQAIGDALSTLESGITWLQRKGRHRELECLTCKQLDECEAEQAYLVDGILPAAQGGVIGGRFKTLKTSVAIDLAISVATARPFLGRFNVTESVPVGIISAESGKATLKETARRVAAAKEFALGDVTRLVWSTSLPRLPDEIGSVRDFIENSELGLLLLDPAYLMLGDAGDAASNVFKMGVILSILSDLISRTGCTIVLLHHHRKARGHDQKKFDAPELGELSQSGFAEWARFWVLLGPRREWDPETGEHWLWMATGGSAGHAGTYGVDVIEGRRTDAGGRQWRVTALDRSELLEAEEREREKKVIRGKEKTEAEHERKLLEALRLHPNGETQTVLAKETHLNGGNFATAIRSLTAQGRAESCDVYKNKIRRDGYRPVLK